MGNLISEETLHKLEADTRFTTETIRKLFPQHTKPISGWKTTDMAFYEIIKRENYFKITLSLCSDNLTDEQRAACDRVSQALNRPDRKEDWRWKRIRNWPRHTIESEPNSENYKEEIYRYSYYQPCHAAAEIFSSKP